MDSRNRVQWGIIGLVVLVVGVAGLLLGARSFGAALAQTPILPNSLVERWNQYRPAALVATAVLALLLAWYGARLLLAQFRRGGGRPAMGDLDLSRGQSSASERRPGRTVVRGPALSHSTEHVLKNIRGVDRALVGLFGSSEQPDFRAQLDVDEKVDLGRIRSDVDATLERLTRTMGVPPRSTDITIRLVKGDGARVS